MDLDIVKLWSAREGENIKDGFGIVRKDTGRLSLGKNRKRILNTMHSVVV